MAKLRDLVSCAADVTGIPFPTVQEVSRRLREGDLIQTSTSGRHGGNDMTTSDAVNLLTGLLIVRASSVSLGKIAKLTRFNLDLRAYEGSDRLVLAAWGKRLALPQLYRLKRGHTFGEALNALLGSIASGDLKQAIANWASRRPQGERPYFTFQASILGPRPHSEAQIEFDTAAFNERIHYLQPRDAKNLSLPDAPRKLRDLLEQPAGFDLEVKATVREQTFTEIGRLLSEEK